MMISTMLTRSYYAQVWVKSPIQQAGVIALDMRSDFKRYISSSSRTNFDMHHSLVSVVRTKARSIEAEVNKEDKDQNRSLLFFLLVE